MKYITIEAKIIVNEDALNEVLETYRNTKTGGLDTKYALNHILNNGLGDISLSLSGDMRKIELDSEVEELTLFEKENPRDFTSDSRILAVS